MKIRALQKVARILWVGVLLLMVGLPAAEAQQPRPTDVKSALTALSRWQFEWTSYHLRMEIEGEFVRQTSDLYCYPIVGGRVWKLDVHSIKPDETRMIFHESPGDVIAYFPELDLQVFTEVLPGYVDVLFPTLQGATDEDRIIEKTKSSSFTMEGDLFVLTLVFDARKVEIQPFTVDITMIIRFDVSGQIHQVEQRRLGLVQTTTFTYMTFDMDEVKARMPITPDAVLTDPNITFEKALEESSIYFKKEQQLQRNRL